MCLYRVWPRVLDSLVIAKPATVVKWRRKGFRIYWRRRSHCPGRPKTSAEIRALIRRMSRANPLWGVPRIHGELLKLGIEVSQATVGRHLPQRRNAPSPTWRSFLWNHMTAIAAVDMFVVATATFKLPYAVIVLNHQRRRVIHFEVTQTRPKPGSRGKSPRPSLGTPHLAICSETEIRRMVSASKIVSERWELRKS
jgi:putative transposase